MAQSLHTIEAFLPSQLVTSALERTAVRWGDRMGVKQLCPSYHTRGKVHDIISNPTTASKYANVSTPGYEAPLNAGENAYRQFRQVVPTPRGRFVHFVHMQRGCREAASGCCTTCHPQSAAARALKGADATIDRPDKPTALAR